ncbi:hypothetical protein [Quadrisphaera setariae]|uniref:hypothetical protein n=1 Tax=Quadrisphaera setariae TaxID=2593304 RepID=UPI002107EFA2|nr:hypothetical protein [Quadrisphaera setariae]
MSQHPVSPVSSRATSRRTSVERRADVDREQLQRRTVRSLALAQVVGAIGVAVTPSVGVLLAEQVTSSEVWAGVARTGSTLGAALAGLPLAALAVRCGAAGATPWAWGGPSPRSVPPCSSWRPSGRACSPWSSGWS